MEKDYLAYHYKTLNKSCRQIAEESGCSLGKVHSCVTKYGLPTNRGARQRKIVDVKCDYCSKPFIRRPSTKSKKNFCSYEHYHLWMVGNTRGANCNHWQGGITAISSNNLKTPEFRDLKKMVLAIFPVCAICGADRYLHVHHIKTRREAPELTFEQSNLITVCRSCHATIKGKETEWQEFFMRLVCKGGELLGSPNVKDEGYQQPSQSNVRSIVDWKVQRLTGEDTQTNKPDTSAAPERDDIVRAYRRL